MTVPRTYFALVPLEDGLVAVAGKHNRMALSSVEKYKFQTNDWTQVAALPNTLFSHAGCSYKNKVCLQLFKPVKIKKLLYRRALSKV